MLRYAEKVPELMNERNARNPGRGLLGNRKLAADAYFKSKHIMSFRKPKATNDLKRINVKTLGRY
jgi:hypothetical protein